MPKKLDHTRQFKDQAVRLVAEERTPSESRSAACARLGTKLGVKTPTLYSWVKQAIPRADATGVPGSVEELRGERGPAERKPRVGPRE